MIYKKPTIYETSVMQKHDGVVYDGNDLYGIGSRILFNTELDNFVNGVDVPEISKCVTTNVGNFQTYITNLNPGMYSSNPGYAQEFPLYTWKSGYNKYLPWASTCTQNYLEFEIDFKDVSADNNYGFNFPFAKLTNGNGNNGRTINLWTNDDNTSAASAILEKSGNNIYWSSPMWRLSSVKSRTKFTQERDGNRLIIHYADDWVIFDLTYYKGLRYSYFGFANNGWFSRFDVFNIKYQV